MATAFETSFAEPIIEILPSGFRVQRMSAPRQKSSAFGGIVRFLHSFRPSVEPKTKSMFYSLPLNRSYVTSGAEGGRREQASISETDLAEQWLERVEVPEKWLQALDEIDEYSELVEGWRGPGTRAVSQATRDEAITLARLFSAELPEGYFPMVGSDDDGNVVFTWDEPELIGNLSVRGNGRYTYVIERSGAAVTKGVADIYGPFATELLNALRA